MNAALVALAATEHASVGDGLVAFAPWLGVALIIWALNR